MLNGLMQNDALSNLKKVRIFDSIVIHYFKKKEQVKIHFFNHLNL